MPSKLTKSEEFQHIEKIKHRNPHSHSDRYSDNISILFTECTQLFSATHIKTPCKPLSGIGIDRHINQYTYKPNTNILQIITNDQQNE